MSEIPPAVITAFLSAIRNEDPELAESYFSRIAECFDTEAGRIVLELLEKCVITTPPPPDCSDCALRQRQGQHLLVAEIRRIVKHGRPERHDRKHRKAR